MSVSASAVMAAREELTVRVRDELSRDSRVDAAWVGGSSGRGEADALSDLDVAVVLTSNGETLVDERVEVAARIGPLVAYLDSPHNAPVGGGQLNTLYNVSPLPVWVDWNYWPSIRERPADVTVLLERSDRFAASRRSYEEIQHDLVLAEAPDRAPRDMDHFRFMMIPIVAKYAVRGWRDSVVGLLGVMGERAPDALNQESVLRHLGRLLDRLADGEPDEAVACVRTYLGRVVDVL